MDKIKTTEGDLIVRDARFAIVAPRASMNSLSNRC